MVLLPLIASRTDLPIIAAGGICDSTSMAAAFVLGAEGVQMGTRMLATTEAVVHANFKNAIVSADDASTVLISVPGNPTMRVLRNAITEKAVRLAIEEGHLRRDTDPEQIAFELLGLVLASHNHRRLLGDREARKRAVNAFDQLVARHAVDAKKLKAVSR